MPRTARASVGDVCYHVLNRGNGRMRTFHGEKGDMLPFRLLSGRVFGGGDMIEPGDHVPISARGVVVVYRAGGDHNAPR